MDMKRYQREALKTDRVPKTSESDDANSLIVPMLGLAGETGQLLSEYKKHLRDGDAYKLFKERVGEELGDLLWYVANVASKFGLDLDHIAADNLRKVGARWSGPQLKPLYFDEGFPDHERFPRRFEIELSEINTGSQKRVQLRMNGEIVGASLTDNAYDADGYRFHDVFHFAYAAVLGWSPVTRGILKRKRKSEPLRDEVEDGGRAAVIEEGISALVFAYARSHQFLDGVTAIDYSLLRTIQHITAHLEVRKCTTGDWEQAILQGFVVWREVVQKSGARLLVDLDHRKIEYLGSLERQITSKAS
jgi:NTP pyrophosphatase (non-canonical NTP hydrolase)